MTKLDLLMAADTYHATEGISASQLRIIHRRTPFHLKREMEKKREETPAMLLGTLVHEAVLEPHKIGRKLAVKPKTLVVPADYVPKTKRDPQPGDRIDWDGKRTLCKEWVKTQENAGLTVVSQDEFDEMTDALARIVSHEDAYHAIAKSDPEVSLFWETIMGSQCKARIDLLPRDPAMGLWDLKTAADASPDAFMRAAYDAGYHIQAAWYLDAARLFDEARAEKFTFIVYEKGSGAVVVYECEPEFIERGRADYQAALEKYEVAKLTGIWPSYAPVQKLGLPTWARKQNT
jgi:hypothetical protein